MFESSIYRARREQLKAKLSGGVVLMSGNSEVPANYPNNTYRFRQDSTFLYFFGLNRPDTMALIDLDSGEETLYGDDPTLEDVIWSGVQPTLSQQAERVGVAHTRPLGALAEQMQRLRTLGRSLHYLPPYRAATRQQLATLLGLPVSEVDARASVALSLAVVALREVKEPCEIAEIDRACDLSSRMHCTAMRLCREGATERSIMGAIEAVALQQGAGVSFPSIVTQHGETLHNHGYDHVLESGRLLLVDAGAETVMNYCGDLTRTFPVNGRFSEAQRAIYDIVLAAHDRIFEQAAPGALYCDLHNSAARVIAEGLRDLGLMRGDMDEAVALGAQALFMPHGLGHQLGLDVHDMENIGERYVGYDAETLRDSTPGLSALRMGKRVKPGFVITVEPGIYFIPALIDKWEREGLDHGFVCYDRLRAYLDFGGIRIEDDMLITNRGNRRMGHDTPPLTVSSIERFMDGRG